MPFEPIDAVTDRSMVLRAATGGPPPEPVRGDPLSAAFRQDNTVVNLLRRAHEQVYPVDPTHNPIDVIRGTPYERNHIDSFYGSQSEAETRQIMSRIDAEDNDRRILDGSGAGGMMLQMLAGTLDPTIALPGGAVVRSVRGGYSIGRSALAVAAAAGGQAAVQEAILQGTQETRTAAETALNVGSATVLGAMIGAGAAALLSSAERAALTAALDVDRAALDAHAGNASPPVARGMDEAATPTAARDETAPTGLATAAGAAAADTRQLELVGAAGLERIPFATTRRVMRAEDVGTRRVMADLAEMPYRFKENLEGVATTQGPALDRLARMEIQGGRVQVSDEMDRLFAEYRFGDPETTFPRFRAKYQDVMGETGDRLTYTDFKREVSLALQEGDTHAIPQVQQAAQYVRRRVFDPWKKRAIEAGLLPEDVEVQTAQSYFQRVYNKQIIAARRPEFVDTVTNWLAADQGRKQAAKERITALKAELDALTARIEKGASEDDVVAATARHAEVREKIEAEIAAWEGKSVSDAKSAIKAREKYAVSRERPEDAPRLAAADAAIDRAVKRIIAIDRDLPVEELRPRAHEITDRILGSPDGRLPYDIDTGGPAIGWRPGGGEPPRGALARREFMIPDAMIRDYLEQDVEKVVGLHLRTMVPDVLLTERFGDVRMTEALKGIQERYAARIDAAKSEKARLALAAERDAAIRDIAAVRDRVRGVYGFSPDLKNMARVAAGAKAVNNLTSMGMAAVSSLPDAAGAVFRYGLGTVLRDGWTPFFQHMVRTDAAGAEFKRQMRAIGIGVETSINSRQHALDDVLDVYQPQTRFERGLQATNDKFFVANLLAPETDMFKTIAAHVAVSEVLRASEAVRTGKATARQIANLAESGIDRQMATRIAEQFEQGGTITDGVRLPNTADWRDQAAASALNGAIAREVDITVVTPGQEKPLWMSHPVISLLGQFKAFTAASTERILIANLQRRDAQVLQGLIVSLGLGMLSYKINSMLGGQKVSERPQDWVKEGISRSGITGWFEEGNALASKASRGGIDMYRLIGADKPLSRFASRSAADMLLGPTWGKLESLPKITGAAASGEWTESDTKAVRRLIAFQNLFAVRGLLNQAEAGVNGAFGIEMKPPK